MVAFTWVPDQGLSNDTEPKVERVSFGDGYSTRQAKGINSLNDDLRLSFTNRLNSEIETIVSFLEARNGVESFTFTPQGKMLSYKYTCQKWSKVYNHDMDASLTCTFKREYDL